MPNLYQLKQRLSKPKNVLLSAILLTLLGWFWFALPSALFSSPTSYVIEDENGGLLSAAIATDGQWRFPAADTLPYKFEKCITAFEDSRFFYHPGVDPIALARAIEQDIKARRIVSGGSTISMQVIRLSRNKPRTVWQKLIEMILALRLEISYSKKEILALYSGNAPFGTNVIGLDAAAWRYFGRSPDKLSWAETATLAVLPNSPSLVHPGRNRDRLISKRNSLLDKLVNEKIIDAATARLAKLEPIPDKPLPLPRLAPHLLDRFKIDFNSLAVPGTRIRTTIRSGLQKNVSAILQQAHQQFKANGINNAAALVLEAQTGNVLAYVGNIYEPNDPEMESQVDMIPALRSPGSTLKPLLYASMLTDGMILPNSLIPDIPTQIGGYTPQNFDLGYDGAIPASRALSRSLNIPAVKMLQQYKYERFYQQLKKLGMTTLTKPADHYGLSLILGGCETSMWELAGMYANLVRQLSPAAPGGGEARLPTYLKVKSSSESQNRIALPPLGVGGIYFTFQAMQEVMRPGEEGLWEQFSSSKKIAWKTGTSFGFRDGWAIGLTTKYVVCVWVGNADGEGRTGLTGIETAAPVMFDIFNLLPASDRFKAPADKMVQIGVCRQSGFRSGSYCTDNDTVFVQSSGVRSPLCPWHQLVHLDPSGTYQVNSSCAAISGMIHKPWFVLPPSMEYYYKVRHREYQALPPFKPGCQSSSTVRQMELIYPKNGAKVYIPVEIDGRYGKVVFNAAHRNPKTKLFWYIDDQYMGTTTDFHQLAVSPAAGRHTVTLTDQEGNRLVQVFEVLEKVKGGG